MSLSSQTKEASQKIWGFFNNHGHDTLTADNSVIKGEFLETKRDAFESEHEQEPGKETLTT